MITTPPRFVINPRAIGRLYWSPKVYQHIFGHLNRSYLNSLWLGIIWNILTLPYRVVMQILWPIFNFEFGFALMGVLAVPASFILISFFGLMGRLISLPISVEIRMNAMVLNNKRASAMLASGDNRIVVDMKA